MLIAKNGGSDFFPGKICTYGLVIFNLDFDPTCCFKVIRFSGIAID